MKLLFLLSTILVPIFASDDDCGKSPELAAYHKGRIVGGQLVHSCKTAPWQVQVLYSSDGVKTEGICGGSIINKNTILTAAHCTKYRPEPTHFVKLQDGKVHRVSKKIEHSGYFNSGKLGKAFDIALLKLSTDIVFDNECVQKICLKQKGDFNVNNTKCTVTGHGTTSHKPKREDVDFKLRMVQVQAFMGKDCNEQFNVDKTDYIKIPENQICAGIPNKGGKDSCQGDSGGPLVCYDEDHFYQAGVVAYGIGCGRKDRPGVYTSAPHYYEWIRQNM